MAKAKELTPLQKGKAEFNLVGKAKVGDFTFKLDVESQKSDWVYNQMNLGVECGTYGLIYADMMGGYGSERDNQVFVHGKKTNENNQEVDDFKNKFTIAWEDRLDEDNFEVIGDRCFITVGIEKDKSGKTIYKKFLSQYDAIEYINENLEDGTVVNVKGSLKYQIYNDSCNAKKEINSIVLSKAEEKDFKATFVQTLLLESDAIGKLDKETRTIPITARVVDFAKEFNGEKILRYVDGKVKEGSNIPLTKEFDIKIGEDKEKAQKMLKLFKAKNKTVTELTVDGYFSKGDLSTVEVSEADIPDDIKELIEIGYIDKDEVLSKIAFSNGSKRPEKMMIKSPHIDMVEVNGNKIPSLAKITEKYTEDDVDIALIIEELAKNIPDDKKNKNDKNSNEVEETDVDKLIDAETEDESDEDDWLSEL